ncbi:hypothetical protein VTG60DRAFT_3488 [Thermothelomyces hinnuleus]
MQSMQRQFGKLLNRGPGENAKVAVLLNDYEDADNVLAKIIDNARMWRDSWAALASAQLQVVSEYEGLYDPIAGASDGQSRHAVPTPQLQLERTFRLKKAYTELKADLLEEMFMIEEHILKPAADARDCIAPIRKTIKKRENKRLDYEKAQDKALKLQRKPGRSSKEEAALAKADAEMARAADEFAIADEHLKETLPPIIHAAFSLVTPLLSNLVMIQNRLLGLYYTTLHTYCEEFGFPSPPPPMDEVVAIWNGALGPVRSEIETISFIARGKSTRQQHHHQYHHQQQQNQEPIGVGNGPRRSATGLISSQRQRTLPALSPSPSASSSALDQPRADYTNATDFTTATILGGAAVSRTAINGGQTPSQNQPRQDSSSSSYFPSLHHHHHQQQQQQPQKEKQQRQRQQQFLPTPAAAAATATAVLGKKKPPPPPPPPKRAATNKPDEWVVAAYNFAGQGGGDLSFREGDRIRVLKRTETDQDWWVGELDGVKGSFPANYCKPL